MKNNNKGWLDIIGSWWWFFLGPLPGILMVFYVAWREYNQFSVFWVYFVIALGSIPSGIVFFFERPNLLGDEKDIFFFKSPAMLTIEQRKVLMFWRKSDKINKIIIYTTLILFLLILFLPLFNIFHNQAQPLLFSTYGLLKAFGIALLYLPFAFSVHIFILSHYLLIQWKNIITMEVEPWPLNKPYTSGFYSENYIKKEHRPSILAKIFNFDPKTPFNWVDFWTLILFFVSIILFWSGIAYFGQRQHANYLLGIGVIILGIVTFYVGIVLWRKKFNK